MTDSQIPVLCACRTNLPSGKQDALRSVLEPFGFNLHFHECESLAACLQEHVQAGSRFFPHLPYAVVMPIISRGDGIGDDEGCLPFPDIETGFADGLPNRRIFVFLIEEEVCNQAVQVASQGVPTEDARIIRFNRASITNCLGEVLPALEAAKNRLAAAPDDYNLSEFVESALNYESVEKRVYVWGDGYGTVELSYSILEDNAEPILKKGGFFEFEHRISVLPDPRHVSKAAFASKLKEIEKHSLLEIFQRPPEAFAVLPFGQPSPKVKAVFSRATDSAPESKLVVVRVTPQKRTKKRSSERLISYGIIWSAEELFNTAADSTVLTCKHSFERVSFSVCFMRPTLSHGWDFRHGPMMKTFGPFMNHLGTNDSAALGDEHFHYMYYPWSERRVPAGVSLEISWELGTPVKFGTS